MSEALEKAFQDFLERRVTNLEKSSHEHDHKLIDLNGSILDLKKSLIDLDKKLEVYFKLLKEGQQCSSQNKKGIDSNEELSNS